MNDKQAEHRRVHESSGTAELALGAAMKPGVPAARALTSAAVGAGSPTFAAASAGSCTHAASAGRKSTIANTFHVSHLFYHQQSTYSLGIGEPHGVLPGYT